MTDFKSRLSHEASKKMLDALDALGARYEVREISGELIKIDPNIYITTPTSMIYQRLDMPWAKSPDEAMRNLRDELNKQLKSPHAIVVVNGKEPDSREFKLGYVLDSQQPNAVQGRCLKPLDGHGAPVPIPQSPPLLFRKMKILKKSP